jgi:threonine/homoserine/homoserine lactone efflux protein
MFSNTYVQTLMLGLGIAAMIYLLLWVLFAALNLQFPQFLHISVSVLGSGYLVYKFLMPRLG